MENITQELTIRQIRKILFDSNKYAVCGADQMTNKEIRDWMYKFDNQDQLFNVIEKNTHLLIWHLNK